MLDTEDYCVEKEIDSLSNVEVLVAMQWTATAWSKVTRATPSCIAGFTPRSSTRTSKSLARVPENCELAPSLH